MSTDVQIGGSPPPDPDSHTCTNWRKGESSPDPHEPIRAVVYYQAKVVIIPCLVRPGCRGARRGRRGWAHRARYGGPGSEAEQVRGAPTGDHGPDGARARGGGPQPVERLRGLLRRGHGRGGGEDPRGHAPGGAWGGGRRARRGAEDPGGALRTKTERSERRRDRGGALGGLARDRGEGHLVSLRARPSRTSAAAARLARGTDAVPENTDNTMDLPSDQPAEFLVRRLHAHERAPVGPLRGETGGHHLALSDLDVDRVVEVREGLAELGREGLHRLEPVQITGIVGVVMLVVDVVGGVELIRSTEVSGGPDLDRFPGQALVRFHRQ